MCEFGEDRSCSDSVDSSSLDHREAGLSSPKSAEAAEGRCPSPSVSGYLDVGYLGEPQAIISSNMLAPACACDQLEFRVVSIACRGLAS